MTEEAQDCPPGRWWLVWLTIVWLISTPYLALRSALTGVSFLAGGDPITPAEIAERDLCALLAVACGILLPLAGAMIAAFTGRTVGAGLYCAGITVVLLCGLASGAVRLPVQAEPVHRGAAAFPLSAP